MKLDNSQIVRERDPRTNRDLVFLLVGVAVLVCGAVLYAWPHLEMRQTGIATEQMQRERERLVEENRKLRLEKASLENLERVESIATRNLRLERPAAENVYIVEAPAPVADTAKVASVKTAGGERN
jgi:cell division protein FtsL